MANKIITFELEDVDLPKFTKRRIVWNEDGASGIAFILIGYCPDTLPYHVAMVQDLVKSFPDANINQVTLGKVKYSRSVQGFTLLAAPIVGPKREVKGWEDYPSIEWGW